MIRKSIGRWAIAAALALMNASSPARAGETVIYKFTGGADGSLPNYHLLVKYFATSKSYEIFGSTSAGGVGCAADKPSGCGTIFVLGYTPAIGQQPSHAILLTRYTFRGNADGEEPLNGLQLSTDETTLFGAAKLATKPPSTVIFKIEPGRTRTGFVKTVIGQVTDLPAPFPPYGIPDYFQYYLEPTSGAFFGVRRYSGLNQCAPAAACGEIVMLK